MSNDEISSEKEIKNPAKRTVLLVASIFAMILGSIFILDTCLTLGLASEDRWFFEEILNSSFLSAVVINLVFSVSLIIFGALQCRYRSNKAFSITLVSLFAVMLFFAPYLAIMNIISMYEYVYSGIFTSFEVIFTLAGLVISIAGLCLRSTLPAANQYFNQGYFPPPPPPPPFFNGQGNFPNNNPYPPQNGGNFRTPPPFQNQPNNAPFGGQNQSPANNTERDKKIAYLKELRDSGDLSEEDFKKLMLKELEK